MRMNRLMIRLGTCVFAAINRRFLKQHERRRVNGIRICAASSRGRETEEHVAEKVERALLLISQYDPLRFRRLVRDIEIILVMREIPRASYDEDSRTCKVDVNFVVDKSVSIAEVAGTIVHEATHARIHRAGIPTQTSNHARIERVCCKAKIAFGRRIPEGDSVIQDAQRCLEAVAGGNSQWVAGSVRNSYLKTRILLMRELGAPRWAIRFAEYLLRKHAA
jgi:hypothetical protein